MNCDCCAIKNLIYQYAHRIDSGDLDSVAAMFSAGSIIAVDGDGRETRIEGREAVLALYRAFTRIYDDDHTPHSLHLTTNVLVEVDARGRRATQRPERWCSRRWKISRCSRLSAFAISIPLPGAMRAGASSSAR